MHKHEHNNASPRQDSTQRDRRAAELLATVLGRAGYGGRGMDRRPFYRFDGDDRPIHLTRSGVRRLVGQPISDQETHRLSADLAEHAEAVQWDVDTLMIARDVERLCEANDTAGLTTVAVAR